MAYVKLDKDLADDWRVLVLADVLVNEWCEAGLQPSSHEQFLPAATNAVLGGLYCLWRYADTHLRNDDRLNLSLRALAAVTHLPVTVLEKFPNEWLRQNDDNTVTLPDYTSKNIILNKDQRRAQTRERVRRFREKQRANQKRGEKRKRNGRNAPPGPGPGPGTTLPGTGVQSDLTLLRGQLARGDGPLAGRAAQDEDWERARRIDRNREIAEAAYAATHPAKGEGS